MTLNQKTTIIKTCTWILAFVFIYTAVSKLYDWDGTQRALYNQVFPIWFAEILLYTIPVIELATAGLLLNSKTIRKGLLVSFILMLSFIGYIGLIMTGVFGRIPCSCGGIISTLGWGEHLVLNIVLLGLALVGIWIENAKNEEIHGIKSF